MSCQVGLFIYLLEYSAKSHRSIDVLPPYGPLWPVTGITLPLISSLRYTVNILLINHNIWHLIENFLRHNCLGYKAINTGC
jgi:hypothetical protein